MSGYRLTKRERAALDLTAKVWNETRPLINHFGDIDELQFHIHGIQRIIMSLPTARQLDRERNA